MILTCLGCGWEMEVAEGGDVRSMTCPACGKVQGDFFTYARTVRFETVESADFALACEQARRGEVDGALSALEEAFRAGYDDFERVGNEPSLATLRSDPRFAALLEKYRKR